MGQSISRDATTDYDNVIGLENMDDKKILPITHIDEDSESLASRDPPPKPSNSKSFCQKWSTSIIFALIIIIFFIAAAALSLSVFNFVKREIDSIPAARVAEQTQKDTDMTIHNLTSRVVQLEMLLKLANAKLDEMKVQLDLSSDAFVELNSSHIPNLEQKFDLLEDQVEANISTLKRALNNTVANVSSLTNQVSTSQAVAQSQFASVRAELNLLASNVSLLSESRKQTQAQLGVQSARLNVTVNETDYLTSQVSYLQSMQTSTVLQLSQLDARHNATADTLSLLSSQVFSLKSNQARIITNLTDLDTRHNATVASVNGLISQVSTLQSLLQTVNGSTLSALAVQEAKLNTTVITLDSLSYQLSNFQKVIESINETNSIIRFELLSLDEKYGSRLNVTTVVVNSLSSQISSLQLMLNATVLNVTSLSTQISLIRENTLTQSQLFNLNVTLNMTTSLLTSQISNLQTLLANVQAGLSSLSGRYNTSLSSIMQQVNSLISNIDTVNAQISTARNNITSLAVRTTTLETSISTLNSGQGTIRNDLTTVQSMVNSFATQLNTLSTRVSSLNSSTRATAYTHCIKDITTCDIVRHTTNRYWYRCTTSYRPINTTGYYTLSTHCQRDPDEIYIDSAYLEISNGFVRCHCDIVGITAGGSHAGIFDPIPTGHCSMVITRCPFIPNTIT